MDTSSQNDLLFSQFHPDIGTVPRPLLTGFYSIRLGLPIKVEDILDSRSASVGVYSCVVLMDLVYMPEIC